ncbi:LysR substrate-binding domain-containing protein [Arthrobacter phoenicis]|jgi:DNA-binding transcriptional LysR family regulator|uniref:LysR substrate-binding domain-containing protein n=2 Tax=Arthrobacter TaxID=1663 RepID=UPI0039A275EB
MKEEGPAILSPRMPELSALEMLVTVQELGSLSAAAALLGLSQQGVSSRMRALETQIGSALLTRSPRGSNLTDTGVLVAGWAAEVLAAAERLDTGIASIRSESARQLHVAASQTIAEHLLPQWLVRLRRQQQALGSTPARVRLSVTNSTEAAAMVRSGAAVLGFIESPNLPHDLATQTVQYDNMVLVTAPDHPWARRRSKVSPAELTRTPLVTREPGSGTREALEHLLNAAAAEPMPAPAVELSTTAAVRTAIAAGIGPGVLSTLAVRDDLLLHRLVAVPLSGITLHRPLTAIWASGATPPAGPARDLVTIAATPQTNKTTPN